MIIIYDDHMWHPRGTQKAPRKHPGGTQDFLLILAYYGHPRPSTQNHRLIS